MARNATTRWWAQLAMIHIGLSCVVVLASCTGPAIPARPASTPMTRTAIRPPTPTDKPIRDSAERELGPEITATMPDIPRQAPRPVDAGAKSLVDAMLAQLGQRELDNDGMTTVSVCHIRNQSHTGASEFSGLRERIAHLLSQAAEDSRVRFTDNSDVEHQYELQGTAYLATAQGLDVWELYISLSPANENWSVWQAAGPVRVLRRPRPGQPQILLER